MRERNGCGALFHEPGHFGPQRMTPRRLGTTDLFLPPVGFGCSSFWAKPSFPERDAIAIIHTCLAEGVNYFDTGPSYSGGEGERRLGRALETSPLSAGAIVSTKAGTYVSREGKLYRD